MAERRRSAAWIAAAILTIVGVEAWAAIALAPPVRGPRAYLADERAWTGPRVDWLILGDSTAKASIDDSVLESTIGQSVVKSAPPARIAWMVGVHLLEELCAIDRPPRRVLLHYTPYWFMRPIGNGTAIWQEHFGSPRELFWLWRNEIVDGSEAISLVPGLVPSIRRRHVIRIGAFTALGPEMPNRYAFDPFGFEGKFEDNVARARLAMNEESYEVSSFADAHVRRTLRVARECKVPVRVSTAVVWEGAVQTEAERAFAAAGEAYLARLADENPGTRLIQPRVFRAARDEMLNNHLHLNAKGRERYTLHVAAELASDWRLDSEAQRARRQRAGGPGR